VHAGDPSLTRPTRLPAESGAAVEPAQSAKRRGVAALLLRVSAGALLLVLVVWYADPGVLWSKLSRADPRLVALAVVLSTVANSLSALRWAVIARGLNLVAPSVKLVVIYARGITTNMLLPGATLSGDLLRSVQLSRLGNPFVASALSVFLDRFSGLWVLCVLSLLAAASIVLRGAVGGGGHVAPNQMSVYLLVLAGIVAVPFIPLPFGRFERSRVAWIAALSSRWERLRARLRQARPALLASVWQSLGVQFLSACTLWICGLALGVSLPYPVMLAAAAPIFIMAALPIGVAGFGTRELAAVVVLGLVGVPSDLAAGTSLLFGLAAVVQGILAAPLFLVRL
jgi:glycosyltransferase 2 family protein